MHVAQHKREAKMVHDSDGVNLYFEETVFNAFATLFANFLFFVL